MADHKCEVCGSPVKVVGKSTLHYERVDTAAELVGTIRHKVNSLVNTQNYEDEDKFIKEFNELHEWASSLRTDEEKEQRL